MAPIHREVAIYLQMKLNKYSIPGESGPQIMNVPNTGTGENRLLDALTILWRKLLVQELSESLQSNQPGIPDHIAGDQERKYRIRPLPASKLGYHKCHQDGDID